MMLVTLTDILIMLHVKLFSSLIFSIWSDRTVSKSSVMQQELKEECSEGSRFEKGFNIIK